jgi:hypothetical protein
VRAPNADPRFCVNATGTGRKKIHTSSTLLRFNVFKEHGNLKCYLQYTWGESIVTEDLISSNNTPWALLRIRIDVIDFRTQKSCMRYQLHCMHHASGVNDSACTAHLMSRKPHAYRKFLINLYSKRLLPLNQWPAGMFLWKNRELKISWQCHGNYAVMQYEGMKFSNRKKYLFHSSSLEK